VCSTAHGLPHGTAAEWDCDELQEPLRGCEALAGSIPSASADAGRDGESGERPEVFSTRVPSRRVNGQHQRSE
jgi:hypothetical protein